RIEITRHLGRFIADHIELSLLRSRLELGQFISKFGHFLGCNLDLCRAKPEFRPLRHGQMLLRATKLLFQSLDSSLKRPSLQCVREESSGLSKKSLTSCSFAIRFSHRIHDQLRRL